MRFKLINPSHFPPLPPRQTDPSWRGVCGSGAEEKKTKHCHLFSWRWQRPSFQLRFGQGKDERDRERKSETRVRRSKGVQGYRGEEGLNRKRERCRRCEVERRKKARESRRPHARSWVGMIAEDHGICWPPYVYKGGSQMSAVAYRALIQRLIPHGKRLSFTPYPSLSLSQNHPISIFPLISLLSSSVPHYPINSLPQCLSSVVLIIKLDLLQVAGRKD